MGEAEIDPGEMSTKEQRFAYPSGWLYLCEHESVHLLIDALLQVDPKKEFTKTELAEFAGVSRQSVRRHIGTLVELGVVAETAGGRRYHYDSRVRSGSESPNSTPKLMLLARGE